MLLHTDAFTHRRFYTQTLSNTDAFTHRSFYAQTLLHTDAFTHRPFCTQKLLHTDAFYTETFTHRSFYTHTHLLRNIFIELLMWNASNVHKQPSTVWQEKLVDPSWNSVRSMLSTPLLWSRFWCSWTIQTWTKLKSRLRQQCRTIEDLQMDDKEVLGLSLFPKRKMK